MNAFKGDPALKSRLIDAIRPRWQSKELLPASILKFQPDDKLYSLCGALVDSQDKDVFEGTTGIPLELAMMCEALIVANVDVFGDPTQPRGFSMQGSDTIFAFGLEWLDAIPPGADLSTVMPKFAVQTLVDVLAPDFSLASQIESDVRSAATSVLQLWTQEMHGETVPGKEWAAVRKAAVAASEKCTNPWCFPIAGFVETVAWPVKGIAAEFVSVWQGLAVAWNQSLVSPFLAESDREDQVHSLKGWMAIARASRDGDLDEAASEALMDSMPESKRAIFAIGDPVVQARLREARAKARVATDPVSRKRMDFMLNLISKA